MSDNISRKAAIDAVYKIAPVDTEYDCTLLDRIDVRYVLTELPSTDRKWHWMSFEQVADMLSGMLGKCACDVNSNDEWLPLACKYADTECPHPKEENGCWMQFLMQGGVDMREDNSSL